VLGLPRGEWRGPLLALLAWTAFGLAQSAAALFSASHLTRSSAIQMLTLQMSFSMIWAVFAPFVAELARRRDLRRRPYSVNILAHIGGLAVCAFLECAWLRYCIAAYTMQSPPPLFRSSFGYTFPFTLVTYAAVIAIVYAIDAYRAQRRSQLAASDLSAQLSRAQLEALTLQLQPHFLFNTLHSISELVHGNARAARRMLAHLSALLRVSFDRATDHEARLRDELEFLTSYLEIQRVRFGEKLRFEIDVPQELLDARVPHLLLQPLAENSIRHGIAVQRRPGMINISARRSANDLSIEIRDNGVGLRSGAGAQREGLGLTTTRKRLQQLYGTDQRLEVLDDPAGGAVARLVIPFSVCDRNAAPEPAAEESYEAQPEDADESSPAGSEEDAQPQAVSKWSKRRVAVVLAAAWAVVASITLQIDVFFWDMLHSNMKRAKHFVVLDVADAAFVIPVALAAIALSRRWPLEAGNWKRRLLLHMAVGIAFAYADFFFRKATGYFPPVAKLTGAAGINTFCWAGSLYLIAAGVAHATQFYGELRARQVQTAATRAQLAAVELEVLRLRLHPQFLLNTLAAIAQVVDTDPEAADEMTARLGDLLRMMLDSSSAAEVTVRQELDCVGAVLELADPRWSQASLVRIDAEPNCLDALVPNTLLQSLIIDALAVAANASESFGLTLRVRRRSSRVEVLLDVHPADGADVDTIEDTLRALRARFMRLPRAVYEIEDLRPNDRTSALHISLPFHCAPEAARPSAGSPNLEFA
jgi:two-component system LytT family sensor kinase